MKFDLIIRSGLSDTSSSVLGLVITWPPTDRGSSGSRPHPVTNPVDNSVIDQVPKLVVSGTREAIEAAQKAQKLWTAQTVLPETKTLRR